MSNNLSRRQRRKHSKEFKAELISECQQPGVSLASVALAHGLNDNLLRRWVKEFSGEGKALPPAKLVRVKVESSQTLPSNSDIQFEIHRGATRIYINWPILEAQACAQWLGDWIK